MGRGEPDKACLTVAIEFRYGHISADSSRQVITEDQCPLKQSRVKARFALSKSHSIHKDRSDT